MTDRSQVGAFARQLQCPCCNNPWNQSSSEENSSESTIKFYALSCNDCSADNKGYSGLDPSNIDISISPKDNFYLWSNGIWMKTNPIPKEYPSWNTFIALRDQNMDRLKEILDELIQGSEKLESMITKDEFQKLSDFYVTFMNETIIENQGIEPLTEIFHCIQNITTNPTSTMATLHQKYGINGLFRIYSSPDKKNSNHTIGTISQSGLGLPDRDYYFDENKADVRSKYILFIEETFRLLSQYGMSIYSNSEEISKIAVDIMTLETMIASSHLTRTQSRDPELTYNKMSIKALYGLTKPESGEHPFNWIDYFKAISMISTLSSPDDGDPETILGEINVSTVEAIKKITNVVSSPVLSHYFIFHTILTYSTHLPTVFVNSNFEFYEKLLKGTQEIRPRWKRGLTVLEETVGEILGKLYVSKHFPVDAKENVLSIVHDIKQVLHERLLEIQWMKDTTRKEAIKKLNRINIKIGYPNKWLDYSSITITKDQHIKNMFSCYKFLFDLEVSRMNKPTDRERWYMTPQTVNAYYHPSLNDIVFPSAILQAPFYDINADRAVQYGSLGAVIGHELTHGFDDQGRKYDFEGNMRDWWAEGDGEEYERRAQVMIQQAEQFEVHGVKLKGKLTCGENIADLGGVKLGLKALQKHIASLPLSSPYPIINGFTPEQRLFLAWSQTWRENTTKERALQLVTLDPHGPNELRCNGTLSNVPEFFEAFDIHEGHKMYRPLTEIVDIW